VLDGTVTRIDLSLPLHGDNVQVLSETRIASGYTFRTDPAALVVGPTGLALDGNTDTLYVASTGDNAIYAIPEALSTHKRSGRGTLVYTDNKHLRGPLALALAPNGDLIAANGDAVNADATNTHNSELIEFTTAGKFVDQFQISPTAGGAFGLAIEQSGDSTTLAAVNDILNELEIWTF
jgi:DNA-binding beta-propeller fold protein YncE